MSSSSRKQRSKTRKAFMSRKKEDDVFLFHQFPKLVHVGEVLAYVRGKLSHTVKGNPNPLPAAEG